jgi:hypothetical protein
MHSQIEQFVKFTQQPAVSTVTELGKGGPGSGRSKVMENTSPCYHTKDGETVRGDHVWSGDRDTVNAHCQTCGEMRYQPKDN